MILSDVSLKCHAVLCYFKSSICINTWAQYHEIRFCCCLFEIFRVEQLKKYWPIKMLCIKGNFQSDVKKDILNLFYSELLCDVIKYSYSDSCIDFLSKVNKVWSKQRSSLHYLTEKSTTNKSLGILEIFVKM